MAITTYAIALGANRRGRHGSPERGLEVALGLIGRVVAVSPTVRTPPLGPSTRAFANAVALVETEETPPALLARLKAIERAMGRRRGRRWGARVIDLDIVLWSDGRWRGGRALTIPHGAFRTRGFVLAPLAAVAGAWRDPVTGRSVRQLLAMVDRRRPAP